MIMPVTGTGHDEPPQTPPSRPSGPIVTAQEPKSSRDEDGDPDIKQFLSAITKEDDEPCVVGMPRRTVKVREKGVRCFTRFGVLSIQALWQNTNFGPRSSRSERMG
jgi:hypothetical protein